ncbi:MAG TPA: hypothetical protein VIF09_29690 [Polyangiaceae bacterium]|jgi:hypothetical protein
MPTSLRQRLDELASSFAHSVLAAIRGASIDDLTTETGVTRRSAARGTRSSAPAAAPAPARAVGGRGRGGRLARRSSGDIARVIDGIVDLLKQAPKGLRAEQIRQKLGLQSKELPRPLKEALDAGRLAKSGQKRATTYFVKGGGGGGGARGARANAGKQGKRGRRGKRGKRGKARKA